MVLSFNVCFDYFSMDDVSTAFVDLVQKEDNNGAVVTIDKNYGAVYRFTKHPNKL